MRGQFSLEFVLDASFVLIIVAFLILFFANFTNTHPAANAMDALCNQIASSINLVSNAGGLSTVQYLDLINISSSTNYNVSVSDGVIIIHELSTSSRPIALISGTNTISCGADTLATANESFLLSNLAIYQNDSIINLEYLAPNYTLMVGSKRITSQYPIEISGGGFTGNTSFSLQYPNGTMSIIEYYQQPFVYNSSFLIAELPSGDYRFSLTELSNPSVSVSLPVAKN